MFLGGHHRYVVADATEVVAQKFGFFRSDQI